MVALISYCQNLIFRIDGFGINGQKPFHIYVLYFQFFALFCFAAMWDRCCFEAVERIPIVDLFMEGSPIVDPTLLTGPALNGSKLIRVIFF
jgi:hypothetical protein